MRAMRSQYGSKKGEQVFYASKNKGTIEGVEEETHMHWEDKLYGQLTEGMLRRGVHRVRKVLGDKVSPRFYTQDQKQKQRDDARERVFARADAADKERYKKSKAKEAADAGERAAKQAARDAKGQAHTAKIARQNKEADEWRSTDMFGRKLPKGEHGDH